MEDQIGNFFVLHGPFIAAVLTGMFTAIAPFLGNQEVTKAQKLLKGVVAIVAISILAIGYLIFSTYWEPKDVWGKWSDIIKSEISDCMNKNIGEVECVKRVLDKNTSAKMMPLMTGRKDSTAAKFYYDIKAGESLIHIPIVSKVFYECFGINSNSFIGSGSTIPWNHDPDYKNADAREFIITNFKESRHDIFTWQFDPESQVNSENKINPALLLIKDLLRTVPPTEGSSKNQKLLTEKQLEFIEYQNNNVNVDAPVIRFQRLLKDDYKGTIGRPEAFKVFAISLQDVWRMNLQTAMKASGFTRSTESSDETVFIWLYLPGMGGEVVPATWGNVISRASKWLQVGISKNPNKSNYCESKEKV